MKPLPSLLVVVFLAVFGVLTGIIVNKLTGIDLYTSMFGSVPGGMQEREGTGRMVVWLSPASALR